jgi:hypothetical protein
VIGGIRDWVAKSIIGAAVTKLLTMFNPVGAVIQAIIGAYNTVMFFIERAQQIAALVEAVVDSISSIAAGNIGAAIGFVERTLARTLPVVISFLARLIGLGNVSGAIKGIIDKIRGVVDKAIDKVLDWIVKAVGSLIARFTGKGGADPRTPEQKTADLDKGLAEGDAVLADPNKTPKQVKAALPGIASKYKLTSLRLVTDSAKASEETDHVEGEVNPRKSKPPRPKVISTSDKVEPAPAGGFRLKRANIEGAAKITGEPESVVEADAAREAVAAELAASRAKVLRVLLGTQAAALIGGGLTVDVIGVTRRGQYVLIEAKGASIDHGLDQLRDTMNVLGAARVISLTLVVPGTITPGLSNWQIRGNYLYQGDNRYLIGGKPVAVQRTR